MINQKGKEMLYYKIPMFVVDLGIHVVNMHFVIVANLWEIISMPWVRTTYKYYHYGIYVLLSIAFTACILSYGFRLQERHIKPLVVLWRAFLQTLITYTLFTALFALVFKVIPRSIIFQQFIWTTPLIMIWHYVAYRLVRKIRRIGRNTRQVVIVGADEVSRRLFVELSEGQSTTGYRVIGFFSSLKGAVIPGDSELLGKADEAADYIAKNNVDEVYCSLPPLLHEEMINKIIKVCNDRFIDFFYVPTMDGYPHRQMAFRNFGKVTIIKLREEPLNTLSAQLMKRCFDIVVSGLFLCTVYPFVMLFVWIGNKVSGNMGPLYFKQARTGYNGKSFKIYKFRSMKVNADADKLQATKDDPRKTPFGDFLRRSSIDELPQFINVFMGDMSIIGPRPHMEYHTEIYSGLIDNYMVRHLAKPGITGWAQINGCRGETKTVEEMQDRVEHDIWYIEHWSVLLDLEIFLKTMWQVIPGHDKQAY